MNKEADLDSSSTKISPISDANKALVRLAFIRCNCSTGGSPAVAILALPKSTWRWVRVSKFVFVWLWPSWQSQRNSWLVAHCTRTVTSHCWKSLKRQHLAAQEILKYFLSVCSELVVAFGPEDVGRRRVEKISETVAKCCQRAGMLRTFFMCKLRHFRCWISFICIGDSQCSCFIERKESNRRNPKGEYFQKKKRPIPPSTDLLIHTVGKQGWAGSGEVEDRAVKKCSRCCKGDR